MEYGARYSSVPTALVMRVVGGIKRAEPKSVRTTRAPAALEVQRMLSGWLERSECERLWFVSRDTLG